MRPDVGERLPDLAISSEGATRQAAEGFIDGLAGRELFNSETGTKVLINGDQKRKIVSNAALDKSRANGFSSSQHFAVAALVSGSNSLPTTRLTIAIIYPTDRRGLFPRTFKRGRLFHA